MKEKVDKVIYRSEDLSLPVSGKPSEYPVTAMLGKTMSAGDEIESVLLVKKDSTGFYRKNITDFIEEMTSVCKEAGAEVSFKIVESDFSEKRSEHERLMYEIVNQISDGAHIIADITYGPKDLPIVLFSALEFAEKFMKCEIDNIVYGQAEFENGTAVNTRICDVAPLYYMNSVTKSIRCEDSAKAKQMLKTLLFIGDEK